MAPAATLWRYDMVLRSTPGDSLPGRIVFPLLADVSAIMAGGHGFIH
jgi:hypothetical protein